MFLNMVDHRLNIGWFQIRVAVHEVVSVAAIKRIPEVGRRGHDAIARPQPVNR